MFFKETSQAVSLSYTYKVHYTARSTEYYVKINNQCKKQTSNDLETMGTKTNGNDGDNGENMHRSENNHRATENP